MPQNQNGNKIKNEILAFYGSLANDPNHRYRSWEHCYGYFRQHTTFDHDIASLHLAFYLASWGMYRGSSALLWKDYKIHRPVISKLLNPKYESLWHFHIGDSNCDSEISDLIVSLSMELKQIYGEQITTVNGEKTNRQPTEILITKILLGAVGCTPACDRFFKIGFRCDKLKYSAFDQQFLIRVFQFYREHAAEFLETQQEIARTGGFDYPVMKLIDMYFWNLGVKLHPESKENESANEA
jgi:hypothetical protein